MLTLFNAPFYTFKEGCTQERSSFVDLVKECLVLCGFMKLFFSVYINSEFLELHEPRKL